MSISLNMKMLFILISVFMLVATASSYAAAPVEHLAAGIPEEQLAAVEHKLLQKAYDNDPLAKRLQRLELSIFGRTQYGNDLERWRRIKHYVSNQKTSAASVSPSLNELEKYVFKKASPGESTAQRLAKLETKLFGQASPGMPAAQRIDRLKRTLGIAGTPGDMAQLPNFGTPRGFGGVPDFDNTPGVPGFGFGDNFGFNDNNDLNQFQSQISQLFREMQQEMQRPDLDQSPGNKDYSFHYYMYRTPDGRFQIGPEPGPNMNPDGSPNYGRNSKKGPRNNNIPNGGKKPNYNKVPDFSAPQIMPQPDLRQDRIPSYADPNFI